MLPKSENNQKKQTGNKNFKNPKMKTSAYTYLNTEMNGNFHFLSFCCALLKVQNVQR